MMTIAQAVQFSKDNGSSIKNIRSGLLIAKGAYDRFINLEGSRPADLRPPETQKLLDDYIQKVAEIQYELDNNL